MFQKWTKSICALAFAFLLTPLVTAEAHGNRGRKHKHKGQDTTVHVNHRNPTPGVARRVRRGRNMTPGVRRGAINSNSTVVTPRGKNRAGAAAALEHGKGRGHGKH